MPITPAPTEEIVTSVPMGDSGKGGEQDLVTLV